MDATANQTSISHWLTLLHCPGIGPRRFDELLQRYGEPETILNLGALELASTNLPTASQKWLLNPNYDATEKDLAWLESGTNHHIISLADPLYPSLLRETTSPPPVLYIHGDPSLLSQPQLSIVGSRNPSAGGSENALQFAKALSGAGLIITSGLALGIDAAAHRGALENNGATIAVTGTGLDRIYPSRHRQLGLDIIERGALISEFPIGTPAKADHFPRRNRIISGLSLGVLVVEAAPRSGSLITARLATEQGREVFAIPGSIHNPLSKGCHALIRQGVKLVENISDILEELGPLASLSLSQTESDPMTASDLDPNTLKVLSKLGHDPVSIDTLIERSQLTTEQVSSILLVLELRGMVSSSAGGLYMRVGK